MTLSELLDFQSNRSRLEEIRRNRRNIVPFVGAGISKSCGLYTWKELLHALAVDYMSVDEMNSLESEGDWRSHFSYYPCQVTVDILKPYNRNFLLTAKQ